jgi:hypothetical protein
VKRKKGITDEALLNRFRGPGPCEWCKKPCRNREAAHVFCKGFGGWARLDVAVNVVALGGPWDCNCHGSHHDGNRPLRCDLLAVVAQREGLLQGQIEETVWRLLRTPKERRA